MWACRLWEVIRFVSSDLDANMAISVYPGIDGGSIGQGCMVWYNQYEVPHTVKNHTEKHGILAVCSNLACY